LESVIGILGITVGSGFLFSADSWTIFLPAWRWALIVFLALVFGFWLKDYVFDWSSWRIRKEKDHLNILVRLKR